MREILRTPWLRVVIGCTLAWLAFGVAVADAAYWEIDGGFGQAGQSAALVNDSVVAAAAEQPTRGILVPAMDQGDWVLHRHRYGGGIDPSFPSGASAPSSCPGEILAQGNQGAMIIVCRMDGKNQLSVRRLLPTGTFDATYAGDGELALPFGPGYWNVAAHVRTDGSLLIAAQRDLLGGPKEGTVVYQVSSSGVQDLAFGDDGSADWPQLIGKPTDLAVASNGDIYLATMRAWDGFRPRIIRLNHDGSLDTSFSVDGFVELPWIDDYGLALDNQDRPIAAFTLQSDGCWSEINTYWNVVRFTTSGNPDLTFGNSGTARVQMYDRAYVETPRVTAMPNGRLQLAGLRLYAPEWRFQTDGASCNWGVGGNLKQFSAARLNDDGSLDSTFGIGGRAVLPPENAPSASIDLRNGKVLILSSQTGTNGASYWLTQLCGFDSTCTGADTTSTQAGTAGNDRMVGSYAADRMKAGAGNDLLIGNGGNDVLLGQGGNDRIRARDHRQDRIRCGSGKDSVTADPFDIVAADCETVKRA